MHVVPGVTKEGLDYFEDAVRKAYAAGDIPNDPNYQNPYHDVLTKIISIYALAHTNSLMVQFIMVDLKTINLMVMVH